MSGGAVAKAGTLVLVGCGARQTDHADPVHLVPVAGFEGEPVDPAPRDDHLPAPQPGRAGGARAARHAPAPLDGPGPARAAGDHGTHDGERRARAGGSVAWLATVLP